MKFAIYKSDAEGCIAICDLNTLEEIMAFQKKNNHPIVIMENNAYKANIEIIKKHYTPKVDVNELVTIPYAIVIDADYYNIL